MRPTPHNHWPQLTDSEPAFFNLDSKSLAVLILADVVLEAGDIDNLGWSSSIPLMIGAAECCKRGVLSSFTDVDGACCSDRGLDGPAAVGLLGLSPLPLFFVFGLPLLAAAAAPPCPTIPEAGLRTRWAWITGLRKAGPLDVSES